MNFTDERTAPTADDPEPQPSTRTGQVRIGRVRKEPFLRFLSHVIFLSAR
jgi:hypothetical protein